MRDLKNLCKAVLEGYTVGDANKLFDLEAVVDRTLVSFPGVKTQFLVRNELSLDHLKVALIFSDFTAIYGCSGVLLSLDEGQSLTEWPAFLVNLFGSNPLPDLSHLKVKKHLAFWDQSVYSMLEPLADSGRVMIRPLTELLVQGASESRTTFIERDSPGELIISEPGATQVALPIKGTVADTSSERQLASILIPYIENISMQELAKILDDEEHLLSDLRVSLNSLVNAAQKPLAVRQDIFNDVVRPAVGKVDSKFRSIVQMHGLKVAGAVLSTAAVGLVAYSDSGIASTIAKVMGPAGISLIAKEVADAIKSTSELRELPFYLLWKLSKGKR